jgi:hypothetical protein
MAAPHPSRAAGAVHPPLTYHGLGPRKVDAPDETPLVHFFVSRRNWRGLSEWLRLSGVSRRERLTCAG